MPRPIVLRQKFKKEHRLPGYVIFCLLHVSNFENIEIQGRVQEIRGVAKTLVWMKGGNSDDKCKQEESELVNETDWMAKKDKVEHLEIRGGGGEWMSEKREENFGSCFKLLRNLLASASVLPNGAWAFNSLVLRGRDGSERPQVVVYRLNSTNIRDPVNPVNRSLPIPNFLSLSMDYRIPTFQSNPKMNEMTRIQNYTLSDSRLHQTQDKPEGDDASLFRSLSTARGGGGGGDVNSSGDHAEHLTQRFDGLKESGYIKHKHRIGGMKMRVHSIGTV
ncbi:hypothetical protein C8Q75DRAFT_839372 [Abortiporus biennis]|nr:hypothetical protein C8Q75DRAFT_839372 [Abortiporus biennis]